MLLCETVCIHVNLYTLKFICRKEIVLWLLIIVLSIFIIRITICVRYSGFTLYTFYYSLYFIYIFFVINIIFIGEYFPSVFHVFHSTYTEVFSIILVIFRLQNRKK